MDHDSEILAIRKRLHTLADAMQTYRLAQVIQVEAIKNVKETVEHIQRTTATAGQLDSFKELCERDFKTLSVDIEAIQSTIQWAARIVIGSVILGVLAMIIKGNLTP